MAKMEWKSEEMSLLTEERAVEVCVCVCVALAPRLIDARLLVAWQGPGSWFQERHGPLLGLLPLSSPRSEGQLFEMWRIAGFKTRSKLDAASSGLDEQQAGCTRLLLRSSGFRVFRGTKASA